MKTNLPSYHEGDKVTGKIEKDDRSYFMLDERGICWYTDEATVEGYHLHEKPKEEK